MPTLREFTLGLLNIRSDYFNLERNHNYVVAMLLLIFVFSAVDSNKILNETEIVHLFVITACFVLLLPNT